MRGKTFLAVVAVLMMLLSSLPVTAGERGTEGQAAGDTDAPLPGDIAGVTCTITVKQPAHGRIEVVRMDPGGTDNGDGTYALPLGGEGMRLRYVPSDDGGWDLRYWSSNVLSDLKKGNKFTAESDTYEVGCNAEGDKVVEAFEAGAYRDGPVTWLYTVMYDGGGKPYASILNARDETDGMEVTSLIIPGEVSTPDGRSYAVREIYYNAFYNWIGVNWPNDTSPLLTLSARMDYANITYLKIPASVEVIRDNAFCGMPKLKLVEFGVGSALREIGSKAFSGITGTAYSGFVFGGGEPDHVWGVADDDAGFAKKDVSVYEGTYSCGIKVPGISWEEIGYTVSVASGSSSAEGITGALVYSDGDYTFLKVEVAHTAGFSAGDGFDVRMYDLRNPEDFRTVRLLFTGLTPVADHVWSAADDAAGAYVAKAYIGEVCDSILRIPSTRWSSLYCEAEVNGDAADGRTGLLEAELMGSGDRGTFVRLVVKDTSAFAETDTISLRIGETASGPWKRITFSFETPIIADEIYVRKDGGFPHLFIDADAGGCEYTYKLTGDFAVKAAGKELVPSFWPYGTGVYDETGLYIRLEAAGLRAEVVGNYPSGIVVKLFIPDIRGMVPDEILTSFVILYAAGFDTDEKYQNEYGEFQTCMGVYIKFYHGSEAQTYPITGASMPSPRMVRGEQIPADRGGLPEYFHVILPESLEKVGGEAFANAARVDVPAGSKLKSIGEGAFSGTCFPLYLPEGVEKLEPKAIGYGTDVTISMDNGYMIMSDGNILSADGTELIRYLGDAEYYVFPDGVRRIAAYAFYGNTAVRSVTLPAAIEGCGMWPFYNVPNLETIVIEEGTKALPDYVFGNLGPMVRAVTVPASVEKVGFKAFFNTALEEVVFADGSRISDIQPYAFAHCESLEHVSFGSSATGYGCRIGNAAFAFCPVLDFVEVDADAVILEIGPYAFSKFTRSGGTMKAPSFGPVRGGILIPRETEYIGMFAFTGMDNLGTVMSIGDVLGYSSFLISKMFFATTYGEGFSITFEEGSVINSVDGAFKKIVGVREIDLSGCTCLETLYGSFEGTGHADGTVLKLPSNLRYVNDNTFSFPSCTTENYEIPASVREIGSRAFVNLARNVTFAPGSELISVGAKAFYTGGSDAGDTPSVDMSACSSLERVDCSCCSVTLPAGAYEITNKMGNGKIANAAAVATEAPGGVLTIDDGVVAVNTLAARGLVRADCAPSSPFSFADGCLTYSVGGKVIALAWARDAAEASVGPDSPVTDIAERALAGSSAKVMRLEKQVHLEPRVAEGGSLREVYVLGSIEADGYAFEGISGAVFYVDAGLVDSLSFPAGADVYRAYGAGSAHVYVPRAADGLPLAVSDPSFADGTFSVGLSVKGYSLYDMDVLAYGERAAVDGGRASFPIRGDAVLSVSIRDRTAGDLVEVSFDGAGGLCAGEGTVSVRIPRGAALRSSEIPAFVKDLSDLSGWTAGGTVFDLSSPVGEDTVLEAAWTPRGRPIVTVVAVSGAVYASGERVVSMTVESGSSLTLHFEPLPCYEPFGWRYAAVGSESVEVLGTEDLVLRDVRHDMVVDVSARYVQKSAGVDGYTNRGLPDENYGTMVRVTELGDKADTSGFVWTGTCSTPLVVDDIVFYRSAGRLYKAESDTGYVLKSVPSVDNSTFYHYLGYGDGVILDYLTGRAYDMNLNQIYLYSASGSPEYHDGYFYSGGTRFVAADEDPSVPDERKKLENLGNLEGAFGNYGYPQKVYVGDYIFAVYASGDDRGITCLNMVTHKGAVYVFDSLRGMLLDDGWLTYHDGTLFLTAYSQGLFGDSHSPNSDRMAWVDVDITKDADEVFGEEDFFEFEGRVSAASAFLVWNGKGYVNAGGVLYVFSVEDNNAPGGTSKKLTLLRTAGIAFSHGSLTMDVSHCTEEEDHAVYLYNIPYRSWPESSVTVVKDDDNGTEAFAIKDAHCDYNTQAMRADLDGRMVWYNDSCHIHIYTVPEKNRFFFFLDDGSSAVWRESYGATPEDALRVLGASSATLEDGRVTALFGKEGEWTVHALVGGSGKYSWKAMPLDSDECAISHYFVINGGATPRTGDEYVLFNADGTEETYVFADNIGDRSWVGRMFGQSGVVRVREVEISATSMELVDGASWRLSVRVLPEDATDRTVTWTSADPDVVSVGADGSVTALVPGTAWIYATSADGGVKAYCSVTVRSEGTVPLPAYTAAVAEGTATTSGTASVSDGKVDVTSVTVVRDVSGNFVSEERATATRFADGSVLAVMEKAFGRVSVEVPAGAPAGLVFACVPATAGEAETAAVGTGAAFYDLSASAASGPVSSFAGGAEVSLPLDLPAGRDAAVWYLPGDGTVERMPCDYADGAVSFRTDHFSVYAVGTVPSESSDGWGTSAIIAAAAALFVAIEAVFLLAGGRRR